MKNIFLIGMPSSGKTSLGRRLARHLGYRFVDLDAVIVEKEGRSINTIFAETGEAYFRDLESATLKAIVPDSGLVIATGGGTPCFFDNMAFIKANGYSFFLDVSPAELLRRMQRNETNERPLYNTQSEAQNLLQTLEEKYQTRRPYYQQADDSLRDDQITFPKLRDALNAEALR